MRTTVTLDSDVEKLVRSAMQRGRKSFKQALNDGLRKGLKNEMPSCETTFKVKARSLGLREGIDPTRLQEFDDELEVEEFRRKTEALQRRRS